MRFSDRVSVVAITCAAVISLVPIDRTSGRDHQTDSRPAVIHWRSGFFKLPPQSAAEVESALTAATTRNAHRHVVVAFGSNPVEADRKKLAAAGMQLTSHLGGHSYFAVLRGGATDAQARQLLETGGSSLLGVYEVKTDWKLHPRFLAKDLPPWAMVPARDTPDAGQQEPVVAAYLLFHPEVTLVPDGVNIALAHGAFVRSHIKSVNGLVIEIPVTAVTRLADEDAVQWLEPAMPALSELNDGLRESIQAERVQVDPEFGLSGEGVSVLLYDVGEADDGHPDFGGRLMGRDASDVSDHATHVAGTIGGSGLASGGRFRGMAPGVTIQSYGVGIDGQVTPFFLDPGDLETDFEQAIDQFGAAVANTSLGSNVCVNRFDCSLTGEYGVASQLIDAMVGGSLGRPITSVWSAGNERTCDRCRDEGVHTPEGYRSMAPPANAKNHITVGAVNVDGDVMTPFSSWGPTSDGRVKPDLVAPGCQISDDFAVTSTAIGGGYLMRCGTSMAAPAVTGAIALLLEEFRALHPARAFKVRPDPLPATIKALLIHSAADLEAIGPDYRSGYGAVRIRDAVELLRLPNHLEGVVGQGEAVARFVDVQPGDAELKVSLVWDDVPATPNVSDALINDLDLRVYDPNGDRHFPWTLDPAFPARSATRSASDHRNNVEQVAVDTPIDGLWRVDVYGYRVADGPQSFSVVISPRIAVDCDGNGTLDSQEIALDGTLDCSHNGLLDVCEPDCDGNGTADSCDSAQGDGDCNANGVLDDCEADCNGNGVPDDCDIVQGLRPDCNGNGVPDDCEPDCNGNGTPDDCDIDLGGAVDCDGNREPDACQDQTVDCNANDAWDRCETARGEAVDQNRNGVPDECEDADRIIHVDVRACPGVGTGWAFDPFCKIQDAIDQAIAGNTVELADGLYLGEGNRNLDFDGKAITVRSRDPNDPVVVNRTVVDAGRLARGFYFHSGETSQSVLDGITIRGGVAGDGNVPGGSRGGGIFCHNSSPSIRRCVVSDCTVGPSLFSNFGGAGIGCLQASPTLEGCSIRQNRSETRGGGIYALDESHPTIRGTTITSNAANRAGGAIALATGSSAHISDCLIAGNTTESLGGGIYAAGAALTVERSTITVNHAAIAGGGLHAARGSVNLSSNILWNNAAPQGPEIVVEPGASLSVDYCDVGDGLGGVLVFASASLDWGEGNLEVDPRFVDAAGADGDELAVEDNDFDLSADSPCVDAGDPNAEIDPAGTDVNGEPREQSCRLDIGSDESAFFRDCNDDQLADACQLADGTLADLNRNHVPDLCEVCSSDVTCGDGVFCNGVERCLDGLCVASAGPCAGSFCDEPNRRCIECSTAVDCDDNNPCTDDLCVEQACLRQALPGCGPTISLRAVAINDQPIAAGATDWVSVKPGDRVSCDILIRNWAPQKLNAFQATLDAATLATGPRGTLSPLVHPTPSAGAFINRGRADYIFVDEPAITVVANTIADYVYIGVTLFRSVDDPGRPAYAGTLELIVGDDAVGSFQVGFRAAQNDTFLNNDSGQAIRPLFTEPLTIRAEAVGCVDGPDCNANGVWDACDLAVGFSQDCNATGIPDECDVAPLGGSDDCDLNGVPDECEADCNGNGQTDRCDLESGVSGDCNDNDLPDDCEDCNGNLIADECDLLDETSRDCNGNDLPDECDVLSGFSRDCNGNHLPDECDIVSFAALDCNQNGVPDSCDVQSEASRDCDGNSIPDECEDCNGNGDADRCDIDRGTSDDCNGNGLPDECEDCNGNGLADECETADGLTADCNANGVPDTCEDCNLNGVADECDIEIGTSADRNRDGVPDECDLCALAACDDQLFCNGSEPCLDGVCGLADDPCEDVPFCDEAGARCVACFTDGDCDDGNDCTTDFCQDGQCRIANHRDPCDEGDRCTRNDVCSDGGCGGNRVEGCDARILLTAVLVNGEPVSTGDGNVLQVAPGDRITCEIRLDGWQPDSLRRFQAVVDESGFTSAAVGSLDPVIEPTIGAGGFIDQDRTDFVFFQRPTLTAADKRTPSYRFESLAVFDSIAEPVQAAYGGTLVLDVSADAAGAFHLGFVSDPAVSFLENGDGERLWPLSLEPLVVSVPPAGCAGGLDCNINGVADACDLELGASPDCNGNDVPDECDVVKRGGSVDCSGNGIPDECEPDCNQNGFADSCDILNGAVSDCNDNGVPDLCEDCNQNGVGDDCDVASGTSADCNDNGLPDECDIAAQTSADCTGNGVPDECEADCDGNGAADSCDIANNPALDADANTFLDTCQNIIRVPEDIFFIQDAIDAADPGDHIVLSDRVYTGPRNRDLNMHGKVLTIRSENGPESCVIDLSGLGRGFVFESGETRTSVIEGLTIRRGRAIHCEFSSPTIRRCIIEDSNDGGIVCRLGSRPDISNSLIVNNAAPIGAGLFCRNAAPILRHCTLVGNSAEFFGGGIYADSCRPTITHSILWNNTAFAGDQLALRFGAEAGVSYSDVQGGRDAVDVFESLLQWGDGNLNVDPSFVDLPARDLRLDSDSRCINAGDFAVEPPTTALDLDGDPRLLFGISDIGADEATLFDDCDGDGKPDWLSALEKTDCNQNAVPDECEDCNGNGSADECDLATGTSNDCNGNTVPDECEALAFVLVESDPPDGAIDAAQPTDPTGTPKEGWRTITMTFDFDPANFGPTDVTVSQQGGEGTAPRVRAVEKTAVNELTITLSEPIQPGAWTTVTHVCSGQSVRLGFLPGDINGDGVTNPAIDLTALIDCINQGGCESWQGDVNRSGGNAGVLDLTRLIDLLQGAGVYDVWAGRTLP